LGPPDTADLLSGSGPNAADIQAKLYPHRDPDKIRREVDRMISSRLMGIRYPDDEPNGEPDPAAMI